MAHLLVTDAMIRLRNTNAFTAVMRPTRDNPAIRATSAYSPNVYRFPAVNGLVELEPVMQAIEAERRNHTRPVSAPAYEPPHFAGLDNSELRTMVTNVAFDHIPTERRNAMRAELQRRETAGVSYLPPTRA